MAVRGISGTVLRYEITYISLGDIFRCLDPFDLIADLLNGIHQAAHIASNVVQKVDGRHGS